MSRHARALRLVAIITALFSLVMAGAVGATSVAPITVLGGLNGTFFLAADEGGAIYAYEGGAGNTEIVPPPAGAPTNTPPLARGLTGRIIRIAPDGGTTTIAAGLPSYRGSGIAGLAVADGVVWALVGTSPAARYGVVPYPTEGFLVKVALAGGAITPVADIAGYEAANSPQRVAGHPPDSNPWGVALGPGGDPYVTDAAGNDLLRVDRATGAITLVALFNGLIANDKICVVRHVRLNYSPARWSSRSQCRAALPAYPSDETDRRGGGHETALAQTTGTAGATGRGPALGPRVPGAAALDGPGVGDPDTGTSGKGAS